jgi:hypothetical protein
MIIAGEQREQFPRPSGKEDADGEQQRHRHPATPNAERAVTEAPR